MKYVLLLSHLFLIKSFSFFFFSLPLYKSIKLMIDEYYFILISNLSFMIPHQHVKNDHYQHLQNELSYISHTHSMLVYVYMLFFSDSSDLYLDISHVNSIERLLIVQYNNKYESLLII